LLTTNVIHSLRDRITGARAEHPLVICRTAPDNKLEEQATVAKPKGFPTAVTHPHPRYLIRGVSKK